MPAGRSQLTGNSAGGRGTGSSSNYKEKRGGKPPDSNSNNCQKVMMVMGQWDMSADWVFDGIKELWFWVFKG